MRVSSLAFAALGALSLALASGCSGAPADDTAKSEDDLFEASPLGSEPAGSPTRYPIVLAHGFAGGAPSETATNPEGSLTDLWSFYRVEEALVRDGHQVHVAKVPPFNAPEVRARALAAEIDEALAATGAKKVNLIAHSMGGLDARVLISGLGYQDRVASLTTISTPHQGSLIADAMLHLVPENGAINAMAGLLGHTFTDAELADQSDVHAALASITEANARAFNAKYPDAPGVYYQSWAGVSSFAGIPNPADDEACEGKFLHHAFREDRMNPALVPVAAIVAHGPELRPNDGMSTVASAKWGTFRGCVPADHLDEVGQIRHDSYDTHSGFDHVRFYRNIAYELAKMGF